MFRALLLALVYLFFYSAASAQNYSSYPKFCHALSERHSAFGDFNSIPKSRIKVSESARNIQKFDIVCIGRKLRFREPIFTNGGNIYIFADEIEITSTIDTRVYRPYDITKFFLDAPVSSNDYENGLFYYENSGYENTWTRLTRPVNQVNYPQFDQKIRERFEAYYSCKNCRQLVINANENLTLIPRLPDGATPPSLGIWTQISNATEDGLPPSIEQFDFSAFRSGSVFLFARKVLPPSEATEARIIVAGIDGGIGGAGSPPPCTAWPKQSGGVTLSCGNVMSSGISAPGSSGADAGNIVAVVSESENVEGLIYSLTRVADIRGGKAASIEKLKTPAATDRYAREITEFNNVGTWPTTVTDGQDGRAEVTMVNTINLIDLFYNQLVARSIAADYDFAEFALRAAENRSIDTLDFFDYLSKAFDEATRSHLLSVVEQMERRLLVGLLPDHSRDKTVSVFCGRIKDHYSAFTYFFVFYKRQQALCDKTGSYKDFEQFILDSGGLLAPRSANITTQLQLTDIRLAITENAETWARISKRLLDIKGRLIDIFRSVEINRLEGKKRLLNEQYHRLEEIKQSLEAQQNKPFSLKVVTLIGSAAGAGNAAGTLTSGLGILFADGEVREREVPGKDDMEKYFHRFSRSETLEKAEKVGSDAKLAFEKFNTFKKNMDALNNDFSGEIDSLDSQIKATVEALQAVEEEIFHVLDSLVSAKAKIKRAELFDLEEIVYARSLFTKRKLAKVFLVDDIMKHIFISLVARPKKDFDEMSQNIGSLHGFLSSSGEGELILNLSQASFNCRVIRNVTFGNWRRNNEDCIRFRTTQQEALVEGLFRSRNGKLIRLPLAKFGSWSGTQVLPIQSFTFFSVRSVLSSTNQAR